jgi:cysteinyl-tRNA synthetase
MPLQLHDTLARAKRPFQSADPDRVTLYVCGPTVYSYAHIGNARPAVAFDVLFRVLRAEYGEAAVHYARNVTDVDDKIIAAAAEAGEPPQAITRRFEAIYNADMAALGCLPPTATPRATEHMAGMIATIEKLLTKGKAYEAAGPRSLRRGGLPGIMARCRGVRTDDMIAGARVEVADYKRSPADFVLWKPAKPGEPAWPSPWGEGRPGWHLECTAMIEAELGLPIDIHGGGHDLVFPHHENEIAQGRCAHDLPTYARYWMHNGFLTMGAEKMSKSRAPSCSCTTWSRRSRARRCAGRSCRAINRAPLDWTGDLIAPDRAGAGPLYGALRRRRQVDADAVRRRPRHLQWKPWRRPKDPPRAAAEAVRPG